MGQLIQANNNNLSQFRLQLQEFANNGATLLNNAMNKLVKEQKRSLQAVNAAYQQAANIITTTSLTHSKTIDKLTGNVDKLTTTVNYLAADMKDMQIRQTEAMEKIALALAGNKTETKIIEKHGPLTVESRTRGDDVPVNYATAVLDKFYDLTKSSNDISHDISKVAVKESYNQSGTMSKGFMTLGEQFQNGVLGTLSDGMKSFRKGDVNVEKRDFHESVHADGISLREAFEYLEKAQLLATNIMDTRDRIIRRDKKEILNELAKIKLNEKAKAELRERGYDPDDLDMMGEFAKTEVLDDQKGDDEEEITLEDVINIAKATDELKETVEPIVKQQDLVFPPFVSTKGDPEMRAYDYYENTNSLGQLWLSIQNEKDVQGLINYIGSRLKLYDRDD